MYDARILIYVLQAAWHACRTANFSTLVQHHALWVDSFDFEACTVRNTSACEGVFARTEAFRDSGAPDSLETLLAP